MMKALVYHGPGQHGWDTVDDPTIIDQTDIVVRIDTSTICSGGWIFGHLIVEITDGVGTDVAFADATNTGALKVVLNGTKSARSAEALVGATSAG